MKKILILSFILLLNISYAKDFAVMDFDKVFVNHPDYPEMEKSIQRLVEKNQKLLEEKENEFIKLLGNNKENNLKDKQVELIMFKESLQKELDEKEDEFFTKIKHSIKTKLTNFNKNKFKIILDTSDDRLIFYDKKIDITDDFIKYLKSN